MDDTFYAAIYVASIYKSGSQSQTHRTTLIRCTNNRTMKCHSKIKIQIIRKRHTAEREDLRSQHQINGNRQSIFSVANYIYPRLV
jgi:hypothetical protein